MKQKLIFFFVHGENILVVLSIHKINFTRMLVKSGQSRFIAVIFYQNSVSRVLVKITRISKILKNKCIL